jgi:hypothetical protein
MKAEPNKNNVKCNINVRFKMTRFPCRLYIYDVFFVDCCLPFCTFSSGHCLVCPFSFDHCFFCPSSNYGFWLPLWYLQTLLIIKNQNITTTQIKKNPQQMQFIICMIKTNLNYRKSWRNHNDCLFELAC